MPFTFSHPALVLPLALLPKRRVSLTGLVIGSLTPDFEYFLKMHVGSQYSHTLSGLFWFDVPLGLLLAFIFHLLIRNCFIDNLPAPLYARLVPYKTFNWGKHFRKYWPVVLISLLVGAASHIFWDGFTHKSGFFVQTFPVLKHNFIFGWTEVRPFKVLQHASTLVGAGIIVWVIYRLPHHQAPVRKKSVLYWPAVLGLTTLIVTARLLNGLAIEEHGNVIVTGITAGLLSLIITPFLLRMQKAL